MGSPDKNQGRAPCDAQPGFAMPLNQAGDQAAVTSLGLRRARRSIQPSEPISRAKALPKELVSISGTGAETPSII